jgi:hypothetical protein
MSSKLLGFAGLVVGVLVVVYSFTIPIRQDLGLLTILGGLINWFSLKRLFK